MSEWLELLLKLSVALFMIGNLLSMGLVLNLHDALASLRNRRFVMLCVLVGFVIGPAIAWLLARWIPMPAPYGIGLVLIGMTPCAPFLPMLVERAHGDSGYAAAFIMLASIAMVIYVPLMVPVLVPGLSTDAWIVARPLLSLVLAPLGCGLLLQKFKPLAAQQFYPALKKLTGLVTIILLLLCGVIYGQGFIDSLGHYAIAAQASFYVLVTLVALALGAGLAPEQKSVLALGVCTRNLGAAFAPLLSVAAIDERAIVMVALGVPLQSLAAVITAFWLGRRAQGIG